MSERETETEATEEAQTDWEKAKAFAAERKAAFEALGDLGLTDWEAS